MEETPLGTHFRGKIQWIGFHWFKEQSIIHPRTSVQEKAQRMTIISSWNFGLEEEFKELTFHLRTSIQRK